MNEKWEAVPSHLAEPQPNGKHLQTVTLCGDLGIWGLEDRCRWGSGGWGAGVLYARGWGKQAGFTRKI